MGWLEGEVVLITGAGGIGGAIARRFVAEGALVAIMDRDATQLNILKDELADAIVIVEGDVTDIKAQRDAVNVTLDSFGKLDCLVANAAVFDYFTPLERIPEEDLGAAFTALFATNVQGYLMSARCGIEALRKSRGSIIFTLSNSAHYAGGGGILYVASKHAAVGVLRQLAFELAPDVRVNGVSPGATRTAMKSLDGLHPRSTPLNEIPGFDEAAAKSVPLRRTAEPEDHTGHYVLLASRKDSPMTTGHIIHSDGGWEVRSAVV